MKLKKLEIVLSVALLGLMAGGVQAAGHLISFSNGTVADADDVNNNFEELAKRIEALGAQKAPGGPTEGKGIKRHTWAEFDAALGWEFKTFLVKHTDDLYDKEVRSYTRTPIDNLSGTIEVARERTLNGAAFQSVVLNYSYSLAELSLNQKLVFDAGTTTLLKAVDFKPGIKLRHDAMGEGINWASATTLTETATENNTTTVTTTFAIDKRSLLKIEDITVLETAYKACQKVLIERSGTVVWNNEKIISWYCPKNVGLVKQVFVGVNGVSKLLEFDPTQSKEGDVLTILPVPGIGLGDSGVALP